MVSGGAHVADLQVYHLRYRDLVSAMVVAQVIDPASKLATSRGLRQQSASSSLGEVLGVSSCDEDDPTRPAKTGPAGM